MTDWTSGRHIIYLTEGSISHYLSI